MLTFVERAEAAVTGRQVLLGGDFNLDPSKGAIERNVYDRFLTAGFKDVYAQFRATQFGEAIETLCRAACPISIAPMA